MLSTPPEEWTQRLPDDKATRHPFRGRLLTFDELAALRASERLDVQSTVEARRERYRACRKAIAALADVFAAARIDVAVLIGNDQMECFRGDVMPAFGVMWGETIRNSMYDEARLASLPPGIAISIPGYIPPDGAEYPGVPDLGRHIIECAIREGFDVTSIRDMPYGETPHAFGFIYRQIMNDRPVPSVPVFVNTYYPPNQPTVQRCAEFGSMLVRAIESWKSHARVAIIGSGGLTHFAIDEEFDRRFLDALRTNDLDSLTSLDEFDFQSGTSELKNWIPVASAMAAVGLTGHLVAYVPCYRSAAGTGTGMGFMYWQESREPLA